MLSESLAKARTAIEADLEERRKLFRHEVDRIKQEMGAMGVLSSGPIIERVRKICESEIEERARVVLKCLLGTLQTDGIALTEPLARGLKDEARKYLTPDPADLVAAYQEVTRGLQGFEKKRLSFARPYSEAQAKLDAEIDRRAKEPPTTPITAPTSQPTPGREAGLAGTPSMPPKAESSPVPAPPKPQASPAAPSPSPEPPKPQAPVRPASAFPVSSPPAPTPVPSVAPSFPPKPQMAAPPSIEPRGTGASSAPERAMPRIVLPSGPPAETRRTVASEPPAPNGQVAANPLIPPASPAEIAETEDQKRLAEALAGLRREVGKRSWLGGFPRDEVVQLIAEAQAEVDKERPNRFRFSAIGHAIAALPETPAAMQSIYKQLKEALAPFGVSLP